MRRFIENKQLINATKARAFQTDGMEIRYDCAKCYHILCMNCASVVLHIKWHTVFLGFF